MRVAALEGKGASPHQGQATQVTGGGMLVVVSHAHAHRGGVALCMLH